jgi:GMP synthase (glutamine-hydrolysing)
MRIHFLIHAAFEKPGIIESWAISKGHKLSFTHVYKGEKLPDVSELDFLVLMGGPQSPTKLDQYPYLRDEIKLAKQAIDQKKVVLGVCLGAQLIGESLGAATEHSPNKEIGVYPIYLTKEGEADPLFKNFPKTFEVMHWHNDMPGLSPGAVLLAYSEGCPRQVVKYSDRVYGLQCHLEMTAELIRGLVEHCASDLKPGKYVEEKEKLLTNSTTEMNQKLQAILDHLEVVATKKLISEKV